MTATTIAKKQPYALPQPAQDNDLFPPSFGGPQPSWIANDYEDDVWKAKSSNPILGMASSQIDFRRTPARFRSINKWIVWGREHLHLANRFYSEASYLSFQKFLGHLFRFADRRGATSLQSLTGGDLREAAWDYARIKNAPPGAWRHKGKRPVEQYLETLYFLYRAGPAGSGLIPDGLLCDPRIAVAEVVTSKLLKPGKTTAELPEEDTRRLLGAAIEFIENKAAIVLKLIAIAQRLNKDDPKAAKMSENEFYKARRLARLRTYEEWRGLVEEARTAFDLASHIPSGRKRAAFARNGVEIGLASNLNHMTRRFGNLLVAVCYLVVAGFTGFRAHEILSITTSSYRRKGESYTMTDAFDAPPEDGPTSAPDTVRTHVRKTSALPDGAEIDRSIPPVVGMALDRLAEYHSLIGSKSDRIFVTSSGNPSELKSITIDMRMFAKELGVNQRLQSHQFRRFFALQYIRRHEGNIDALRRHFRHVSRWMIMHYLVDASGAVWMAREKTDLCIDILSSLMFGDGNYRSFDPNLPLAERLGQYRAQNLPAQEIEKRIKVGIEQNFSEIRGNPWGYCILQPHDTGETGCGAKDGTPDAANTSCSACGKCNHFVIGQEHLWYWQHIFLVHQDIVESPISTPILKAASREMLAIAERAINLIEQDEANDNDTLEVPDGSH